MQSEDATQLDGNGERIAARIRDVRQIHEKYW